jgi:integrase
VVDYVDQHGDRTQKTFARKKDADAWAVQMRIEVRDGTHTAHNKSATVAEAGKLWIASAEANGLERATRTEYERHVNMHLAPIGAVKLADLSLPRVRAFEDTLHAAGYSAAMVKRIRSALGMLISDAQERGLVARNVVHDLSRGRKGRARRAERRAKGKLKIGVDIPTPDEIRRIIAALQGLWRPFFLVAIFCGLRASELRGLRWRDLDFATKEVHVRQRADRYNEIGRPKSEAGERTVPVPPLVLNALREWKLACPKGALDLVFPTERGTVQRLANILIRPWRRVQVAAGVVDENGEPKYTGLHALRHFFASWCINRKADGGLELPGKVVQERLGHSTIAMTMDTYGHLFPRSDDGAELAAAERSLWG